ncbi:MAG: hypothetical protein GX493_07565, partial [Firmicutes bacterium]|nr:hypothetical protein [Bacillota bacterium]
MEEQRLEIWQKTLETIAPLVSTPSYNTWLKPTRPVAYEDGVLYVEADNDFARGVLESRYAQLLLPILRDFFLSDLELRFVLPNADRQGRTMPAKIKRTQGQEAGNRPLLNP